MSYSWFCSLNPVDALKTKRIEISIDRNIGVKISKTVQIIGWWTDIDYFMNGNIFILEIITEIQNSGSESIHSRYSNVDVEGIRM